MKIELTKTETLELATIFRGVIKTGKSWEDGDLLWDRETEYEGLEWLLARPAEGVSYRVITQGNDHQGYLTTGGAHKFTRPITEKTDDIEAAKSACEFHWHNAGGSNDGPETRATTTPRDARPGVVLD